MKQVPEAKEASYFAARIANSSKNSSNSGVAVASALLTSAKQVSRSQNLWATSLNELLKKESF
jgi:hypothetical protein